MFRNIDHQSACLIGHDQKYIQLSAGKYTGHFQTINLSAEVCLYFETFNQTLQQFGASPQDRYGVILLLDPANRVAVRQRDVDSQDVMLVPPGCTFEFHAPPGTHFCVVSIDRDVFERLTQDAPKRSPARLHETSVLTDADFVQHLAQSIGFLRSRYGYHIGSPRPGQLIQGATRSLLSLIGGFFSEYPDETRMHIPFLPNAQQDVLRRMQDYILVRRGVCVRPAHVAAQFSISRRHMENLFRRFIGVGPAEYIRIVKFNAFRSELLAEARTSDSIGDIAAEFELWHLGRLSGTYNRLFGELPSEARRFFQSSDPSGSQPHSA